MNILFPKRMKDVTIIVHDSYLDEVVEGLHSMGEIEISNVERDTDLSSLIDDGSIHKNLSDCTEYEMKLTSVQDVFSSIEVKEEGIKDLIFPKEIEPVKREMKDFSALKEEIDDLMDSVGKNILKLSRELNKKREKIEEFESIRRSVQQMIDIDIDLSYIGDSPYTVYRVGKTQNTTLLKRKLSEIDTSHLILQRRKEKEYIAIAGAYIRDRKRLDMVLRETNVKIFDFGQLKGIPSDVLDKLDKRIREMKKEEEDLFTSLVEQKKEHQLDFFVLEEELEIFRNKMEAYQQFGRTDTTAIIKGWAPEDLVPQVEREVKKQSRGYGLLVSEEPRDPDYVPVSLDNPKLLKPFELLTRMFAPPRYDEVDPTLIIAPAFVIFFGLMLGDAVYGGLIIAVSLVLYYGIGKIEKGTRDFSLILLAAGLSTFIFGILQGGYLGPNREEYLNLLGRFGLDPPLLLDTLEGDGPLILLIISLLIGLAYINIGLVLSLIQHIRRKNYRHVLLENVSWWLLQPGGFILLSGMLFGWYDFTGTVYTIAAIMSVVGLGLLVVRAKGLSFFALTGFLGDFLSFARILALGLATAGIALTVNVLAYLVADGSMGTMMALVVVAIGSVLLIRSTLSKDKKIMGAGISIMVIGGLGFIDPVYPFYILSLVVLVGGHIINASLQALGSFVHSLRLQYVEFFGYFYEGGGTEFKPFKPERRFTTSKEGSE